MTAEELARLFHETYERLAPVHGYATREASAKPWEDVPEQNRTLMIATSAVVLHELNRRLLKWSDEPHETNGCSHKFVDSNVCLKCGWAP